MSELSHITLPDGIVYNLKDATARAAMVGGMVFLGITTTPLTDGSNASTVVVDGDAVSAIDGGFVMYGNKEFIYTTADYKWHEFGDATGLKALAYKDTASGVFTPSGSVSQPTFTGSSSSVSITATDDSSGNYQPKGTVSAPTISVSTAGSTTTIKDPTSTTVAKTVVTAAPGATAPDNAVVMFDVVGETLRLYQVGYTTGASITTENKTVKTGDASYTASQPEFTGTKAQLSGTTTASGTVSQPTFTGTQGNVSVS